MLTRSDAMFTDSHCHLASHKFSQQELPELIERAASQSIHRLITLATCLKDIPQNLAIAKQFPTVFAAVGIHPCDVCETPDEYLATLRTAAQHPQCCAIGETGLDYFHPAPEGFSDADYHQRQRDFLQQHFTLAQELGKNIVIHTRDKTGYQSLTDAIAIYRPFASDLKAVFHCFLGPIEHAQEILALGGYLSYTGITTFKKATNTLQAAIETPLDRIMVETDSPYLAPTPHRGKRNEPAFAIHTATHIAEQRGMSLAEFAAATEANVETFFDFSEK